MAEFLKVPESVRFPRPRMAKAKKIRGFDKKAGSVLRAFRRELDWSKADLGQQAGCNEKTVANAEKLRPVSDSTATHLTDAINRARRLNAVKMDGEDPFVSLDVADLFAYNDATGRFEAKTAPDTPDERRALLRALLSSKARPAS